MNITIEMIQITCPRCGNTFCVSDAWVELRRKFGKHIFCPKGHKLGWDKPEEGNKPSREEIEKRREKIRVLHEMEQAEARASDPSRKTQQPAAIDAHAEVTPSNVDVIIYCDDRGYECGHCGKKWKVNSVHINRHLHRAHGIEGSPRLKPVGFSQEGGAK